MILEQTCRRFGFDRAYVLPPTEFPYYRRRQTDGALDEEGMHLCADPSAEYPWANAVLLLLYAYKPYPRESSVSGYYPASNRSFFLGNDLMRDLSGMGIRCERVYLPIRECALRFRIGSACRSGLTAFGNLGTRVIAHTFLLRLPEPVSFSEPGTESQNACPSGCRACERACPADAIGKDGYEFEKCARAYMKKAAMPRWVMEDMQFLLGCEICQFVCPLNHAAGLEKEVPDAFRIERILEGDIEPALLIVGKNLKSGGRLIAHAIVLAAHQNRTELLEKIQQYEEDPRPAVRSAAQYAIPILQEGQQMR